MTAKFGFQVTVNDKTIWLFPEDLDAALAAAKAQVAASVANASAAIQAQARAGIAYSWTRGPGEDPIRLGSFDDLLDFIDNSIINALPENIRPTFKVQEQFENLILGLPDPINGKANDLTTKAFFEIDSLRLKIPGKAPAPLANTPAPVKNAPAAPKEKFQFEIAILINLLEVDLQLGPFKLNRLYAKLGNFDTPVVGQIAAKP